MPLMIKKRACLLQAARVEDLDQLPFLKAVVQEGLRLGTPATTAIREVEHDFDAGQGLT